MNYKARRLENIRRNRALVQNLGLERDLAVQYEKKTRTTPSTSAGRDAKRRKIQTSQPARRSARIFNASSGPAYNEDTAKDAASLVVLGAHRTPADADDEGTYHFASHPSFTPNKSPEAIIREGSFGGSYWRPLYSKKLHMTISGDWRELPGSWTSGLSVPGYLTSETYNPEVNKYGVACGQSIEEWEAAGWIAHEYDVRGWFQWCCRFWMGRRCADDERQIGRWRKCVGETGRWRRTLLKKYVQTGIRSVADEGEVEDVEERGDVSPVVHQTCHHWAWEVRQEALERFWRDGNMFQDELLTPVCEILVVFSYELFCSENHLPHLTAIMRLKLLDIVKYNSAFVVLGSRGQIRAQVDMPLRLKKYKISNIFVVESVICVSPDEIMAKNYVLERPDDIPETSKEASVVRETSPS
ncbi:hypothetical protein DL768_011864 [Monosporascus sp. mg162]|nr:hypothetical protein DL768_011864 [Monosporascus sp. mg162]